MQFNKRQFKKVNDKKVLKKVKKSWITVSVATLATLGGAAAGTTMLSLGNVSANSGVNSEEHSDSSKNSPNSEQSSLGELSSTTNTNQVSSGDTSSTTSKDSSQVSSG
ncbi:hypothetical protein M2S00_07380, partial [Apilactobacillus sp. TMW 2.2459]|uniref:hypothetical protein n=1 Tax=Apilactobacillus xinyiensis TaxID=2841032 RepID=UPI00200DAD9D